MQWIERKNEDLDWIDDDTREGNLNKLITRNESLEPYNIFLCVCRFAVVRSENNAEWRIKYKFMICLEGDEPPIDAVMISAKDSLVFSCVFFSVGFYGTQINGPLQCNKEWGKNEKLKFFPSLCADFLSLSLLRPKSKRIIKAIIKRECWWSSVL